VDRGVVVRAFRQRDLGGVVGADEREREEEGDERGERSSGPGGAGRRHARETRRFSWSRARYAAIARSAHQAASEARQRSA
jgi:hypothetical protein